MTVIIADPITTATRLQCSYARSAEWRNRVLVRDWTDLEAALIGRVEELIDFVTQP